MTPFAIVRAGVVVATGVCSEADLPLQRIVNGDEPHVCDAQVQPGWLWNGGQPAAPPRRTPVVMGGVITAAQLATPIAVPAGATWTAKGQPLVGPQDITFGAAGIYPIEMTGQWSGRTTVTALSASEYEAWLLAGIDERREVLLSTSITGGDAIKDIYAQKRIEKDRANGVLPAVLNALAIGDKAAKYPMAWAEAQLTGDTLSAVLDRIASGANAAMARQGRIEAIAQKAKRAVRAASTVAAKRAAANVTWT